MKWMRCSTRSWVLAFSLLVALSGISIGNRLHSQPLPPLKSELLQQETAQRIRNADLIRVGLSDDAMTVLEYPSATVSATGAFRLVNMKTSAILFEGQDNQAVHIQRQSDGFILTPTGQKPLAPVPDPIRMEPAAPGTLLKVPSTTRKGIVPAYRGTLEITPGYSAPSVFTLVNVLPLQDYLKAVVPNELPYSYGYEAVKAQAVAARNYALHPREKPWPHFDICDSQYCQAYYGAQTEHPQTTRALEETQGLIALYQGEPILALYSSSHGGHSENYEYAFSDPKTNRFPATPLPYLQGKPDVPMADNLRKEANARAFYTKADAPSFDVKSPHYRWQRQWTRAELEALFNRNLAALSKDGITKPFLKPAFLPGDTIGELQSITVLERGVSGKAMRLRIQGSKGVWIAEKEFVIRKAFQQNGRYLPSANLVFTLARNNRGQLQSVRAHGGGFGHGVGMSQLGASYLSKAGHPFAHILQHYYSGIAVGSIPLTAQPDAGMQTAFYVPETAAGVLYVESQTGAQPVTVKVNNGSLTLTPDQTGKAKLDVANLLKADRLNTLVLPPQGGTGGSVKAWIEVYPPKTGARS